MHELIAYLIHLGPSIPDPGNGAAPPGMQGFTTILGWSKWYALGLAVLALIVAGASLMIPWLRERVGEHITQLLKVLIGILIICAAYSIVGFLAS
jgi:uncharacterized membrane protein